MPNNEPHKELVESFQLPASVRLLWEATQKALQEWGMDRSEVVALCNVIVRLADDRLLIIEACGSPSGTEEFVDQVRHYRQLAADLLRWTANEPPEPDWDEVNAKLLSVGAAPLDHPPLAKE